MTAQHSMSESEELRLLYQITAADLAYFKTQQWSVTNYTLLLFAGVVGVAQMLKPNVTAIDRIVLVTVTIFVATSALVILAKLQKSVRYVSHALTPYALNSPMPFILLGPLKIKALNDFTPFIYCESRSWWAQVWFVGWSA